MEEEARAVVVISLLEGMVGAARGGKRKGKSRTFSFPAAIN